MTVPATSGLYDRRAQWCAGERPFRALGGARPARPARPNIVFILGDDLGWGDLGVYGSLHHRTPRIDTLARDGVRFTHAYSTSATCSPTRISLYTGRYPGRLVAGLEEPLRTRDEHHGIPHDHPTLPSLLRDGGYRTAMFGKWHCGWLPWFSPIKAGFETFFGNLDGAMDYFSTSAPTASLTSMRTRCPSSGSATTPISSPTARRITSPLRVTSRSTSRSTSPRRTGRGRGPRTRPSLTRSPPPLMRRGHWRRCFIEGGSLAAYSRMVAALDAGVGRILDALDERGIARDTIVCFGSDNGGERFAFLWPFVGEKGDLEEGGIRIPFLVRWPAAVNGGQLSDMPNVTTDWTATLLDAAGVAPAASHPLDGHSLLPWLLDGEAPPQGDMLWRTRNQGAVRRGPHKLLIDHHGKARRSFAPNGPSYRLFDVTVDGREMADISGEHPEIVNELRHVWEAFDAAQLPYPATPSRPELAPGTPD